MSAATESNAAAASRQPLKDPHKLPLERLLDFLGARPDGLNSDEASAWLLRDGPNELIRTRDTPLLVKLLRLFKNFFAVLLTGGGALALFAERIDPGQGNLYIAYALLGVVLLNGLFAFAQEHQRDRTLAGFRRMLPDRATVVRDGRQQTIAARELVAGDMIVLAEGDRISADARPVEQHRRRWTRAASPARACLPFGLAILIGDDLRRWLVRRGTPFVLRCLTWQRRELGICAATIRDAPMGALRRFARLPGENRDGAAMNIERILVTTDLSEASFAAFPHAAHLASRCHASLSLIHVDETSTLAFASSEAVVRHLDRVTRERGQRLDHASQQLSSYGVAVEAIARDGKPWRIIQETARELRADLVVLTKLGTRRLERLWLGSTTTQLVRHADRPMLVVPASIAPISAVSYRRVIVSTDFSEASRRGLRSAAELARVLGATVQLAHVLRLPMLVGVLPGESVVTMPDMLKRRIKTDAADTLGAWAQGFDVAVDPQLLVNRSVAEALVEDARGEDLIVIPSQGKGAWRVDLPWKHQRSRAEARHRACRRAPRSPYLEGS